MSSDQAENNSNKDKESKMDADTKEESTSKKLHATVDLPLDWTQMAATSTSVSDNIRYPLDVAPLEDLQEEYVFLVGTHGVKITHIGPDLYQTVGPNVKQLILRSHLIHKMEGFSQGFPSLELLELYDNAIEHLTDLDNVGPRLRTLDMSYNVIRSMKPVHCCTNLQELYLANNKLKAIEGLECMTQLKRIDLGANRIRVMEPRQLQNLCNLEELWLGKNKIERIQGLEPLTNKLRKLDVQANRLTSINGDALRHVASTLEELYLSHNGIDDEGARCLLDIPFQVLNTIDLSRNRLTTTKPFANMFSVEQLWLSGNQIESFDDVQPISILGTRDGAKLETIYLEYNPLDKDFEYRKKLKQLLPSLTQIDANLIQGYAGFGDSVLTNSKMESLEERMRRMQEKAIARAKEETLRNAEQKD